MKKILISYLIMLSVLIPVSSITLGHSVSVILKSLMYLSVPTLVALGVGYILIEHVIGQSKKQGHNQSMKPHMSKGSPLLRLI